jgi:hypothetical protein
MPSTGPRITAVPFAPSSAAQAAPSKCCTAQRRRERASRTAPAWHPVPHSLFLLKVRISHSRSAPGVKWPEPGRRATPHLNGCSHARLEQDVSRHQAIFSCYRDSGTTSLVRSFVLSGRYRCPISAVMHDRAEPPSTTMIAK